MKFNFVSALLSGAIGALVCYILTLIAGYDFELATIAMYVTVISTCVIGFSLSCSDNRKAINIRIVNVSAMLIAVVLNLIMMAVCDGFNAPLIANALILLLGISISRSIYNS